eukprot:SAG31_NODE_4491_length_3188_cov_5.552784_2_plen_49_part_00
MTPTTPNGCARRFSGLRQLIGKTNEIFNLLPFVELALPMVGAADHTLA